MPDAPYMSVGPGEIPMRSQLGEHGYRHPHIPAMGECFFICLAMEDLRRFVQRLGLEAMLVRRGIAT